MGDRPDGLIVSQARDRAAIHDLEDTSFAPGSGVGRLVENAPHLAVATWRPVAVVCACALVVAGGRRPPTRRDISRKETSLRSFISLRGPQALKDSHDSVTCSGSPEVSSIAFHAQPLDLHSVFLMDVGFAAIRQLARTPPASYPVLVHRPACLLHASITSRPSRCEEDLHLKAIDHARHNRHRGSGRPLSPATPPGMRVRTGRFCKVEP